MNNEERKILKLYQDKRWSTYQIAEKLNTYPNKVRRILTKNGIKLRNSKNAQTNAKQKSAKL